MMRLNAVVICYMVETVIKISRTMHCPRLLLYIDFVKDIGKKGLAF